MKAAERKELSIVLGLLIAFVMVLIYWDEIIACLIERDKAELLKTLERKGKVGQPDFIAEPRSPSTANPLRPSSVPPVPSRPD